MFNEMKDYNICSVISFSHTHTHIYIWAGIAQWYYTGLRAGWVPAGAGNFSLHCRVQTGFGAHRASIPMGTRGSFLGVRWAGREANHSPQSSSEVKNAWSHTSTLNTPSWSGPQLKHRDNFTFSFSFNHCIIEWEFLHIVSHYLNSSFTSYNLYPGGLSRLCFFVATSKGHCAFSCTTSPQEYSGLR